MNFVNRKRELERLRRHFGGVGRGLACVWGRRRLGKSRLLREALGDRRAIFVVGDDRDAPLQRAAVAREIGRLLPGFDAVPYPTWEALLERYCRDADESTVLVLDELPALVARSPELPGVLQRVLDGANRPGLAVCGSSQRMMQGLVLDASAPLYGRASEILRLQPMAPRAMAEALALSDAAGVISRYAVFGGVPRYWELLAGFDDLRSAVRELVLDPLGVLHDEPERLLLDDVREVARAASILSLIGQGCHRLSEIAGRIGQPATSLTRPLERLLGLDLVTRETPWGVPARQSRRTLYRVADPLLAFWYRYVEPNRSRLAAGALTAVDDAVWKDFPMYLGRQWEAMVRWRVPRGPLLGRNWQVAARWWGPGDDGVPLELDAVAESADEPDEVLVVEAKVGATAAELPGLRAKLEARARRCPALAGRRLRCMVWVLSGAAANESAGVLGPEAVLDVD